MRVIYSLRSKDRNAVAAEAAWAESVGHDGVSNSETDHDPFMPLILAATATSRVSLETHVAIAFPRSPMVTAHTSRDLQDLSHGRLRLGLGTQVKGHIERRFSTRWESPGPRLREYVESLRAIWDCWNGDGKLDYQGKFYQFSLMTPFFNPGPSEYPSPPVFTAAINAYNCQVAGQVSDGLMLHSLNSPEYMRQVVQPNIARGAQRAQRDPSDVLGGGGGFIITGPNRASLKEKEDEVRRRISFYASTRTYFPVLECHGFQEIGQRLHRMSLEGLWSEMGKLVNDEMLDAFTVMGEYDEVAAKFLERYGGLVDEVNFSMSASSTEDERHLRRIIRELQEQD
jgi:probable F420-dependent oxidoreductase